MIFQLQPGAALQILNCAWTQIANFTMNRYKTNTNNTSNLEFHTRPQFWISSFEFWGGGTRKGFLDIDVWFWCFWILLLSLSLFLLRRLIYNVNCSIFQLLPLFLARFPIYTLELCREHCRGGMRWSWFGWIVKVRPISVTSSHIKLQMKSALFPHDSSQFSSYHTFHFSRLFSNPITHKIDSTGRQTQAVCHFLSVLVVVTTMVKDGWRTRTPGTPPNCNIACNHRFLRLSGPIHPLFGCDFQGHFNHRQGAAHFVNALDFLLQIKLKITPTVVVHLKHH